MRWLILWVVLGFVALIFVPVGFWCPLALIPLFGYLWHTERSDRRLQAAFARLVEEYRAAELDRE